MKAQFSRFTRICPTFINLTEDILTMLTSITGHDSVLLRAEDPLI
ncbi:transcriptional regulator, partial [Escherichia coli]|nr:transcriptional regulator [Escherichia coli]